MDKEYNWNKLYKIAGLAALVIVLIIPIQILIFSMFPPPEDSIGFITLFHDNWLLGLLSGYSGHADPQIGHTDPLRF